MMEIKVHVRMRLLLNNALRATYNLVAQVDAGASLTFTLKCTYILHNAQSRMQSETSPHPCWGCHACALVGASSVLSVFSIAIKALA